MVRNIKEIHPKTLLIFKVGAFCESYGKDSYIISYLFGYKLKKIENMTMCGFPLNNKFCKLRLKKVKRYNKR